MADFGHLLEAERAFVDRAAQARAIRWAAQQLAPNPTRWLTAGHFAALADRIDRGDVTVPEEGA